MSLYDALLELRTQEEEVQFEPVVSSRLTYALAPVSLNSLHISDTGLQLLEYFEGCRLTAYRDSKGVLTIGYGHTGNVTPGQSISHAVAVQYLAADIKWSEDFIKKQVHVNLLQYQFDALVTFVFNIGVGNFLRSSVLSNVNASQFDRVPYSLSLWNKSGGSVIAGLVTRRHAEGVLFSRGTLDFAPVHVPDNRQE